ncbi:MAG: sulfotransferase family protein [Fibrobacterota bacterium]
MVAVTGMHRSGTSCITGLLCRCGFSLGFSHPLLNDPRPDNAKGHHENLGVLAINETILKTAGGSWYQVPNAFSIDQAGEALGTHIQAFNDSFDGSVVKDPRLSLTISSWRRFCSQLDTVVFCVRNPIGVALSLQRRDGLPIETGLNLWLQYNTRFLQAVGDMKVVYFSFDFPAENMTENLTGILQALGRDIDQNTIKDSVENFFDSSLNHDTAGAALLNRLPANFINLYTLLCKKADKSTRLSAANQVR